MCASRWKSRCGRPPNDMAQRGYVRQRRGELDHHAYFGERPSAYLTYSHVRLLADHRTGVAEVNAKSIAHGTGLSVRVVRADLRWLTSEDEVTGRPAYLRVIERGNQHVVGAVAVVKYSDGTSVPLRSNVSAQEGAVTSGGNSTEGAVTFEGNSTTSAVTPKGNSTQANANNGSDLQRLRRRKKKKKEKNPSTKYPSPLEGSGSANGGEGFSLPIGVVLSAGEHTRAFASELALGIHREARFSKVMAEFLVNEVVPGFNQRRRKDGATCDDFIRYARTRMSKLIEHEARTGKIAIDGSLVRPGSPRFVEFVDEQVTRPWRRVRDSLRRV